jgi:hypothetical protein
MTGYRRRTVLSRVVVTTLAATMLTIGLGAQADAYHVYRKGCHGGMTVPRWTVKASYGQHFAYFPERRVSRSRCYSGRQIIKVTYRMWTGYPYPQTNWTVYSRGPGNNAPAYYYLYPGASYVVRSWEGWYGNKDYESVDVRIKWFTDKWVPLGSMYIDYDNRGDYRCDVGLVGGCGTAWSSWLRGYFVWFH